MGFPGGSDGKESACNVGDLGSISGFERSPGGGDGNPFQHSCVGNPMNRDYFLGSSVHGDSPGKNTEVGCHGRLQGIFPTQGLNPGLPHCRRILQSLSHQGGLVSIYHYRVDPPLSSPNPFPCGDHYSVLCLYMFVLFDLFICSLIFYLSHI